MVGYKWIMNPYNRSVYDNGDLELKCPFCGYEWAYDEDTTDIEFSKCPKCNASMNISEVE